jgi:hypothetical protein
MPKPGLPERLWSTIAGANLQFAFGTPSGGGTMAALIKKSSMIKGFKRLLLTNLVVVLNMGF